MGGAATSGQASGAAPTLPIAELVYADYGTIAAAGTNQGTATAIANDVTKVTGADAAKGVVLDAATAGKFRRVYNSGTATLLLYPASGEDIADGTQDAPIYVRAKGSVDLLCVDDATWTAVGDFGVVRAVRVNPFELRKDSALKDALADTPGSNLLGLGDSAGSVATGTSTDGGSTATASENAAFLFVLPQNYVDGAPLTLRVRAKVAALKNVSATVDAVVKKVGADGSLGSDINATDADDLTTSYADSDFTITPTGLAAGDLLHVVLTLATDDTGASNAGAPTISEISMRPTLAA